MSGRRDCLLRRAAHDPDAFADFYDAYVERVLVFLTRRLFDAETALDLTSETFAKALQRRHQFRGSTPEEEQAWLFTIARRELSHFWRRGAVEQAAVAALGIERRALTDDELERIEDLAGVQTIVGELSHAMAQLPHEQRRAVELRVVDDLGYDELAQRLEVNRDTARARVSRGLRALAMSLKAVGVVAEDVA